MQKYLPKNGIGAVAIFITILFFNFFLILLLYFTNSYELTMILEVALIIINIYQFYYLFIYFTINYEVTEDKVKITSLWGLKKINIPIKNIKGYKLSTGRIKGIRLSGFGGNDFAIGRNVVDKIGITYMYVTSSNSVIYLQTDDINYGLSPLDIEGFMNIIKLNQIPLIDPNFKLKKSIPLLKDKKFAIPFAIASLIICFITINPIVQYLNNSIPSIMPLSFDAKFSAVKLGTGKQFAFKQMTQGLLNMAVLFFMYYAAYFISKYDRKSVYKYIFIPLALSAVFLFMQIRIFLTYR